jgi:hypothetical protein
MWFRLRGIIGVLGRIDFVERLRAVESQLDVDSPFWEMGIGSSRLITVH